MVDGLQYDVVDGVAWVTLRRPDKHNAISYGMWSTLPELVATAEADAEVQALVLTGAGTHFSAGADIAEFGDLRSDAAGAATYDAAVGGAVEALDAMAKPSVAMIRGNCIGGGCQLAVACDFRFAADTARFGITPAKLGIVYDFGSTRQLVALVGPAHARHLLLTGALIDATRAAEIGLVNEIVTADALADHVDDLVGTLRSRSQPAVRAMNRIIGKIAAGQRATDEDIEADRSAAITGADYAEGVAAFLNRRTPQFPSP